MQDRVKQITKLNQQLENKLSDNRKWLAGKKITIADFMLAALYHSIVLNDNVKHDSLKKAMYETLSGHLQLKEWLKRISTELSDYIKKRQPSVC